MVRRIRSRRPCPPTSGKRPKIAGSLASSPTYSQASCRTRFAAEPAHDQRAPLSCRAAERSVDVDRTDRGGRMPSVCMTATTRRSPPRRGGRTRHGRRRPTVTRPAPSSAKSAPGTVQHTRGSLLQALGVARRVGRPGHRSVQGRAIVDQRDCAVLGDDRRAPASRGERGFCSSRGGDGDDCKPAPWSAVQRSQRVRARWRPSRVNVSSTSVRRPRRSGRRRRQAARRGGFATRRS